MERKFMRGDVFIASLDPIVGSEQGGCRPVLVLQNDIGNQFSTTTLVAAITSQKKPDLPTHIILRETGFLEKDSMVLLEQLRTLDRLRFSDYLGSLDLQVMKRVSDTLAISLGVIGNTNIPLILSLCYSCANQFYNSGAHFIKWLDPEQEIKETCMYCKVRTGFDFILIERKSL